MEHKINIRPATGRLYEGEFSITIILHDNTPDTTKQWFANTIFNPAVKEIDKLVEKLTKN